MTEAKKRNPDIMLAGLVYSFPSWVNPTKADSSNTPYATNTTELNAATYVSEWVTGMASRNLTIDWVGLWNERECVVAGVILPVQSSTIAMPLMCAGIMRTALCFVKTWNDFNVLAMRTGHN